MNEGLLNARNLQLSHITHLSVNAIYSIIKKENFPPNLKVLRIAQITLKEKVLLLALPKGLECIIIDGADFTSLGAIGKKRLYKALADAEPQNLVFKDCKFDFQGC